MTREMEIVEWFQSTHILVFPTEARFGLSSRRGLSHLPLMLFIRRADLPELNKSHRLPTSGRLGAAVRDELLELRRPVIPAGGGSITREPSSLAICNIRQVVGHACSL
jgi:hypothetical protein